MRRRKRIGRRGKRRTTRNRMAGKAGTNLHWEPVLYIFNIDKGV
jgi:hypothetical protein